MEGRGRSGRRGMAQERQEQEAARRQLGGRCRGGAGAEEACGPWARLALSPVCGVSVDTGPSRTDGFSRTDGPKALVPGQRDS